MTLEDVLRNIQKLDPEHTIYVQGNWGPDAQATVCSEPEDGQAPPEFTYFLEVFLVQELMEDAPRLSVQSLIEYAIHDA
ncbi:hypothetical protein [Photobacterium galatheae]|uniref:Uncharacterized protein n=1 Tax=Photobacterium galatheae TaxID=1654360 RepID=A0A066RMA4_9GAMM|nr:hypothetical protein [Photobacterium galatheae]KDM91484.1 hypothetical protein EA58_10685 [Photobacterium galatheae]MCM0149557.1 hypothetical protein [Photobacterium galatheae]